MLIPNAGQTGETATLHTHTGELRSKHHRALVIIRDTEHNDGSNNKGGWQDFIIQFPVGFNILPKLGKGRLFNLIFHRILFYEVSNSGEHSAKGCNAGADAKPLGETHVVALGL